MATGDIRTSVTVIGKDSFFAALARADVETNAIVHLYFQDAAHDIMSDGQELMQEQMVGDDNTGALEGSWTSSGGSLAAPAMEVGVGKGIKYAGWWEFGGNTNSPRGDTYREIVKGGRSLYPAVAKNNARIDTIMALVLKDLIAIISGGPGAS